MLSTGCWCWPPSLCSEWSYSPTSTGGTRTTLACRSSQPSSPSPYIATSSQSVSGYHSYFGSPRWSRELSNWSKAETNQHLLLLLLLQTIQPRMETRKFPRVEIIIFLTNLKCNSEKLTFYCRLVGRQQQSTVQCSVSFYYLQKYFLNICSTSEVLQMVLVFYSKISFHRKP